MDEIKFMGGADLWTRITGLVTSNYSDTDSRSLLKSNWHK